MHSSNSGRLNRFYVPRTIVVAAAIVAVCGIAAADVTVTVEPTPGVVGTAVTIPITMLNDGESDAPATFILFLTYDEDLLDFVGAALGPAVPNDKDLTVEEFDGEIGIAVAGFEENDIGNGTILFVTFDVVADGGGASIPLALSNDSSAASINAEPIDLLLVDGGIQLGCLPLNPPSNVDASDGEPGGVNVTWDFVLGALEYRVFRSDTNDESAASPISDWQLETEFFDATAAAPMQGGMTCGAQGELEFTTYFYFVKARTTVGCDSEFSTSDDGFRGEDVKLAGLAGVALLAALPFAARRWRRSSHRIG